MPHHKRKRHKSARAGCLFCKPHKHQGTSRTKAAKHRDASIIATAMLEIGMMLESGDLGRRLMTDEHAARTDPYDASIRDGANY